MDIIKKDIVKWIGKMFPFRKRVVIRDVEHLLPSYYLKTTGEVESIVTSNYRLIGYKKETVKGLIK